MAMRPIKRWAAGLVPAALLVVGFLAVPLAGVAAASTVGGAALTVTSTSAEATQVTYTVTFTATSGLTNGSDTITLTAPTGTVFAAGGNSCGDQKYGVSVNGGAFMYCGASETGDGTNSVTITAPSLNPAASAGQTVVVQANSVSNTATVGSAQLSVSTSKDTTPVDVPLTITAKTSLTGVNIAPESTSASATQVAYSASATLTNGLTGSTSSGRYSTFTLSAPAGTVFPDNSNSCGGHYSVSLNGGNPVFCGTDMISGAGTNVVTFDTPVSAVAGDKVLVTVYGVANSSTAGSQSLTLSTSSDPAAVTQSVAYTPITSVSALSASAASTSPGATTTYTIGFTSTNTMNATSNDNSSTVTVHAPAGTTLPSSGSCGGDYSMSVNGAASVSCGTVIVSGGGTNVVTFESSVNVAAGDHVVIVIASVINPSSTSPQTLTTVTSSDPGTASATLFDVTAPTTSVTTSATPVQTSTTITVTYTATDTGSGVASYDVRYETASWNGSFGAYQYPATWQQTSNTRLQLTGQPGHQYCFNVRSRDHTGNLSGWSKPWCRALPLDDRALSRLTAHWHRGTGNAYYKHTFSSATHAGEKLRLPGARFTRIALLVKGCPTCGKLTVLVGTKSYVVATYATKTKYMWLILLPRVTLRKATITITTNSAKLDVIDGVAILRN